MFIPTSKLLSEHVSFCIHNCLAIYWSHISSIYSHILMHGSLLVPYCMTVNCVWQSTAPLLHNSLIALQSTSPLMPGSLLVP